MRRRPKLFCASLADWLDSEVAAEWLADLLFVMYTCQNLDFLMLTKRPGNFVARLQAALKCPKFVEEYAGFWAWVTQWIDGGPTANVWIGTTIEDQPRADERIQLVLRIPACVHFLSCEPLLERVKLTFRGHREGYAVDFTPPTIDWVICGGESGKDCRPMDLADARYLRDRAAEAGAAFFMKQLGGWPDKRDRLQDLPEDLRIRSFPTPLSAEPARPPL